MNKTRVDDMLIEMIEPKIQEINQKFTSGESLSQDDINTLLLKSQYNHINHLDDKLNETVESVKSLENKFEVLKSDVNGRLNQFEERLNTFEEKLNTFEQKIETTIQKALNKNMMLLIFVMGFFLTLSKVLDYFMK